MREDSLGEAVCDRMATATHPGAQTERRSDAGPVRGLLGGKTSPAAFVEHWFTADTA